MDFSYVQTRISFLESLLKDCFNYILFMVKYILAHSDSKPVFTSVTVTPICWSYQSSIAEWESAEWIYSSCTSWCTYNISDPAYFSSSSKSSVLVSRQVPLQGPSEYFNPNLEYGFVAHVCSQTSSWSLKT